VIYEMYILRKKSGSTAGQIIGLLKASAIENKTAAPFFNLCEW
jgi:hypothetical protein